MTDSGQVIPEKNKESIDDEALEKLAVEELMREAVQGAARAEVVGASGWIKPNRHKTNKKFLVNTIRHAVASNRYHQKKKEEKSLNQSKKKFKEDRKSRRQ